MCNYLKQFSTSRQDEKDAHDKDDETEE